MTYDYVFDSYAWIEYFRGSEKGKKVKKFVEKKNSVTPSIVIVELSAKYHHENWDFWDEDLSFILSKSVIYDLNLDIANKAGQTRTVMRKDRARFGLADAIILETGRLVDAPIFHADETYPGAGGCTES